MAQQDAVQIADIPIFKDLSAADLASLVLLAEHIEIAKDQRLFREGDAATCFYVVLSGGLDIEVTTARGGPLVVAKMGPGSVVGETSLLIGGQRSASALATEATILLSFPDEQLRELLGADSMPAFRVVYRLAQALAQRQRELDAHIARLSWAEAGASAAEDDLDRLRRIFFTDWGPDASRGSI